MTVQKIKDLPKLLEDLSAEAMVALGADLRPNLGVSPKPEMGDLGFPCFPYARALRRSPNQIAQEAAEALEGKVADMPLVARVEAVGPYVNFTISPAMALGAILGELEADPSSYGGGGADGSVMIEYSSPNTNKPQHLGHIRNNLLGQSVANMLAHQGHTVRRVNLVNDRGIHICKSMLAYMRHGEGITPEAFGRKGDHLIGHFYVLYNTHLTRDYEAWLASEDSDVKAAAWQDSKGSKKALSAWKKKHSKKGQPAPEPDAETLRALFESNYKDTWFNTVSEMGTATRALLVKWEAEDPEVRALWRQLNDWVEAGFEETYERMGVHFDQIDHESETYLLGKSLVQQGLDAGTFYRSDNGAICFDLSRIGMKGEKALLRKDGTSLYTTQDLGTASIRFDQHSPEKLIYVVGNEQDHHFKVLFGILGDIRPETKGRCHHLSYGMVNLPTGKMKSREGTVVDADDLMDEVRDLAFAEVKSRYEGKISPEEMSHRAEIVGLASLKYFLLNYAPQTEMTFNPEASVKFEGRTGPFCLYAYARTASILRKAGDDGLFEIDDSVLHLLKEDLEIAVIKNLMAFPAIARRATENHDPSKIAEHAWKISKSFASFYSEHKVLKAETEGLRKARLQLIHGINRVLKLSLGLLGIDVLEQM